MRGTPGLPENVVDEGVDLHVLLNELRVVRERRHRIRLTPRQERIVREVITVVEWVWIVHVVHVPLRVLINVEDLHNHNGKEMVNPHTTLVALIHNLIKTQLVPSNRRVHC